MKNQNQNIAAAGNIVEQLLDVGRSFRDIKAYVADHSYADTMPHGRIQPLNIVSEELRSLEWMPAINQFLLKNVALLVVSAVPFANRDLVDVEMRRMVGKLSTDRSWEALLSLPVPIPNTSLPGLYSSAAAVQAQSFKANIVKGVELSDVIELELVYEKTYKDEDDEGREKTVNRKLPMYCRLKTIYEKSIIPVNLLSSERIDHGVVERFRSFLSGDLDAKNFFFAIDMLDEKRRLLRADKHGTYADIMKKSLKNKTLAAIEKNPSLATATNIFVITEQEARQISINVGGDITEDFKVRQKLFGATKAMIIAVVSPEWETLTVYYRNVSEGLDLTKNEISKSNPNGKLADAIKDLASGMAPRF